MEMETCFISLGGDCSVSYNLRQLGLQRLGTMPFDWARIDGLETVISILAEEFRGIADFSQYITKPQSDNFNSMPCAEFKYQQNSDNKVKSRVRLVHKVYKLVLPHEYNNDVLLQDEFEKRYARRIARFMDIGKREDIKKVFVRLGTRDEVVRLSSSLYKVLDGLEICNYEVKFVILEDWEYKLNEGESFTWQRLYIPWKNILV